ncbi:hypothetical protein TNCV_5038921 [Trichonephila clavipes]|nr:hypothetical protein TNCV_5038921 [Trichonephila clavipes]
MGTSFGQEFSNGTTSFRLDRGQDCFLVRLTMIFSQKAMKPNKIVGHMRDEKRTATAGSDVVQSGRPIFDDFFQHLWLYIGNNTANVVFQMVKRLWLIRIDQ